MKFTKMQGIGNDYVYVNCFEETVPNPTQTAKKVSDRHFGVGADGMILIKPSDCADCEMEMYNADGSKGAMCGNGIRCVAKYVYDYGIAKKTTLQIATGAGIKTVKLEIRDGKAAKITVDMGEPILEASRIPVLSDKDRVIAEPVCIGGQEYRITAVSMGNPHAVVFLDEIRDLDLEKIGPQFEHDAAFPDRVNTEFCRVADSHTIEMRVWERGSGETLACGTGACAVAVASALNGYTQGDVTVRLLGGDLDIAWDRATNHVFMTGPAAVVFEGEIDLED